jgi:hypothetical protein
LSKLAWSVLRHIRVSSKQELKDRFMTAMEFFNRDPMVHTWTYKLDKADDLASQDPSFVAHLRVGKRLTVIVPTTH